MLEQLLMCVGNCEAGCYGVRNEDCSNFTFYRKKLNSVVVRLHKIIYIYCTF